MKFVGALALVAGVSAFNVTKWIEEKTDKFYIPTKNGFKIQGAPFLTATCSNIQQISRRGVLIKRKSTCNGRIGNGGPTNKFARLSTYDKRTGIYKIVAHDSGNMGDYPMAEYYLPKQWAKPFWSKDVLTLNVKDMMTSSISYVSKGGFHKWGGKSIGKNPQFVYKASAGLTGTNAADGIIQVTGFQKGSLKKPSLPEKYWFGDSDFTSGAWDSDLTIALNEMCMAQPPASFMSPQCTLNIGVIGKAFGKSHNYGVGMTMDPMELTITANSLEFVISGASLPTSFTCHFQKTKPSPSSRLLVFQIVNMGGLPVLMNEFSALVGPFQKYYNRSNVNWKTRATSLVWIDKRIENMRSDAFDCSAFVAATHFESDFAAASLRRFIAMNYPEIESPSDLNVQMFMNQMCVMANGMAMKLLKEEFVPKLVEGREFVYDVVGPEGEARYDTWYKTHGFPVKIE